MKLSNRCAKVKGKEQGNLTISWNTEMLQREESEFHTFRIVEPLAIVQVRVKYVDADKNT